MYTHVHTCIRIYIHIFQIMNISPTGPRSATRDPGATQSDTSRTTSTSSSFSPALRFPISVAGSIATSTCGTRTDSVLSLYIYIYIYIYIVTGSIETSTCGTRRDSALRVDPVHAYFYICMYIERRGSGLCVSEHPLLSVWMYSCI